MNQILFSVSLMLPTWALLVRSSLKHFRNGAALICQLA